MNRYEALLAEFVARKEHVLNLEVRLFILVLVLQALFLLFYVFQRARLERDRHVAVLVLLVYGVFFFKLVAINGKLGLISMYLRQMENHMASLGLQGAVWESKALDSIIYAPFNAFTLPGGLVVLLLVGQAVYSVRFTLRAYVSRSKWLNFVTGFVATLLLLLVMQSLSGNIGRPLPTVFRPTGAQDIFMR